MDSLSINTTIVENYEFSNFGNSTTLTNNMDTFSINTTSTIII